jgi:glycine/D-amino acid oxidase-like deaminating enzyme
MEIEISPANVPVWDDGAWAGLPRLEGDVSADVCVVGLGGSGLTCIGELLRLGASVVGVDAGAVAGGAAGRNGGFLLAGSYHYYHDAVAEYGRERALAIFRATLAEIERITAETPDAVRRVGSLRIAASDDEAADCCAQLEAMRADGLAGEWSEACSCPAAARSIPCSAAARWRGGWRTRARGCSSTRPPSSRIPARCVRRRGGCAAGA